MKANYNASFRMDATVDVILVIIFMYKSKTRYVKYFLIKNYILSRLNVPKCQNLENTLKYATGRFKTQQKLCSSSLN